MKRGLPADQPGIAACGTKATARALASLQIAETSAVEPGRSTKDEWP